jgi:DNA adenine methylase
MKSPFRYPGGKTKTSIQQWILSHRPAGVEEYREPFVGGGGVLFALEPSSVKRRWINDANEGLMSVYRALLERPAEFFAHCRQIEPARPDDPMTADGVDGGKPQNARLKAVFDELALNEGCDQALRYFFVNRTVFGGRVNYDRPSRLYFSKPEGWDIVKGDRLERAARHVVGTRLTCGDFQPLFATPGKGVWIYADPPYVCNTGFTGNSKLYQHNFTEEDHERLAVTVRKCKHKVCLSYDDDPDGMVRSLYPETAGFTFVKTEWAYNGSTNAKKDRGQELLILNYEPASLFTGHLQELTSEEQDAFTQHEAVIGRNLRSFQETGAALRAIRDGRLYRQSHATFERYCLARWTLSRRYVNYLIDATAVVNLLGGNNCSQTPGTESQARELARLRTEDGELNASLIGAVWTKAVEEAKATGKAMTAKRLREQVEAVQQSPPRPRPIPSLPNPETLPGLAKDLQDLADWFKEVTEVVRREISRRG